MNEEDLAPEFPPATLAAMNTLLPNDMRPFWAPWAFSAVPAPPKPLPRNAVCRVGCWQPSSCLPTGPTLPWTSHGTANESQSQAAERGPTARLPGLWGHRWAVTLRGQGCWVAGGVPERWAGLSQGHQQSWETGRPVLELGFAVWAGVGCAMFRAVCPSASCASVFTSAKWGY